MPKRAQPNPRKRPSQARSVATVDAILEAGARILAREGYDGTNVNRVAALAGVSVGSLYQYYPSKEALVAAVMTRHNERMLAVFQEGLPALALGPMEDAVRGIVRRTFAAYALDPALRRVLVNEVPHLGPMTRSREFDEWLKTALEAYLGFHAGEIRPTDIALAVTILVTAVEAIATRMVIEDASSLAGEALHDEVAALVIGYIRKTG